MIEIIRIDGSFPRFEPLLKMILSSFAYMDGVIDPPSSAHRLTLGTLSQKAQNEIAFIALDGDELEGCVFCTPETASLYIGKLAVSPAAQGKGVGAALLRKAEEVARGLSLTSMRLETRIELTGNHRRFARWGFVKTAENSHPGYNAVTSIQMTKRLDDTA